MAVVTSGGMDTSVGVFAVKLFLTLLSVGAMLGTSGEIPGMNALQRDVLQHIFHFLFRSIGVQLLLGLEQPCLYNFMLPLLCRRVVV